MRFSLIVPVYNIEKYLPGCIASIRSQTFEDYEVILIDDGSADGSGELCETYARMDVRIRICHQKNQGQSCARNMGLDMAKGDWIVFVDGDDRIGGGMLERLDEQIGKNPADLYRFNMQKTDGEGHVTERLLYSAEYGDISFHSEKEKFDFYFDIFMQYKMGWEVCGGIYRRDIIREHHIRFQRTQDIFAEDYLFTFHYLLYVKSIRILCDIFYDYVQRDGSTMSSLKRSTVLPRLIKWGECGYAYVREERLKYFTTHYERLYFMLMNHHIQYILKDYPLEEVRSCLRDESHGGRHPGWMKKLQKTRKQWMKYMGTRIWL